MLARIHEEMLDSISHLDEATQNKVVMAYVKYQLYNEEPSKDDVLVYSIFKAKQFDLDGVKNDIKASVENWKKGGRPVKDFENKQKPKHNLKQPNDNLKETEKEKEKEKEIEKENINNNLSPIGDKEQSSYWDENINKCLEIIKKFNWWISDWTQKEQRIYWKNLIWKLKEIDSVKNWNYTRDQVLETILQIVSQNTYHAQKIAWPKKIYYELWWLMQICKSEFAKKKKQEIPFIPWIW